MATRRVFLITRFAQLLLREKPYSSISDEAVRLFSSFHANLEMLETSLAQNSISVQWCTEAMNLLQKMHSHSLLLLEHSEVPISENGANCLDDYMLMTLQLLDLCNLLKSASLGMDRYRLAAFLVVRKSTVERSPVTTIKTEIERLEMQSKKLYGVQRWEDVKFSNDDMTKTKHKISNVHVIFVLTDAMITISFLLFNAMIYPIPIKNDKEVYHKFSQLKFFSDSLQNLVNRFQERLREARDTLGPPLVENKMIERAVTDIKTRVIKGIPPDEQFLKSVKSLERGSVVLKRDLEAFESVVTQVFSEVVDGRNKALGMIKN